MASRFILNLILILEVAVFVITLETDEVGKVKKNGGGACKKQDEKTFHECLKKGYKSGIEECESAENMPDLKPKYAKKCAALEKKLSKCRFDCRDKPPMSPAELLATCSHSDIQFLGTSIFHRLYTSVEECVQDCSKSESCKAITYNTFSKVCYFKSVEGGSPGPDPEEGYISTNMHCDRSGVDLRCQRKDFAYSGADIMNYRSSSFEACALLCRDTENCRAVSYREYDGQCWLKSQRGGSTGPYHSAGYRAMNMECDSDPVIIDSGCVREGIYFYSADLRSLAVADLQECAEHCRETESCKSISFRDSDHQCFLKSKLGGYYPRVSEGYSSLNMNCNGSEVSNLDCMRSGFTYPGADKGNLVVSSQEECARHCTDTEGCKSITFRASDSRCYLKSKRGGDTGPTPAEGHDSMNMECDNSPVRNLDCIRSDTNFPGADLRNLIVEEKEECVRHCRDTELCKAMVFRVSNNKTVCYLKSRRGGSTVPVVAEGYESMNMECDNSKVSNMKCLREGLVFGGADIGNTVVADERECVKLCRDTEGCLSFTFRLSDNRCYAKNRRGGTSGPSLDRNYNSMNMECDNSPVTETMKCLRQGLSFPGYDLIQIVVADVEECIRHCRDTELCQSLTFQESSHRCYLKSRRGGSSGPTVSPGYSSLNLECDNSKPEQLKCSTLDEKFAGHEMRHVAVSHLEECLRRCRDTEGCQAVSFRETDNVCEMKSAKFEWWKIRNHYKSVNMDCSN